MSSPEAVLSSLAERYLDAQLAGDRREALRIVMDDGFRAGITVADLELYVVETAQREIGRLWQENRITIADEHLATAISQIVLSVLYQHLPRSPQIGRKALIACVEGELHDMGGRIGADFLEMAGFDVRFLGANVPTEALVAMTQLYRPDLVGLSATMSYHVAALKAAVAALRESRGTDFPIVVGGNILSWAPELEKELGVAVCGGRADSLVAATLKVLG